VAARVPWLAALAPGASALVLPYTEAVAGALAVGMFLCLRRHRLLGAAACGLLSGLVRPTGVLLAVPAAIELVRDRPRGIRDLAARGLAVVSPLLGTGCYLAWCGVRYGHPMLPYTVQTQSRLRGGWVVNPAKTLFHYVPGGLDWRLNVGLIVLGIGLLVVALRRLPLSYGVWSALMFAAAVTSLQQHSLPRYLANMFPLVMAAALVVRSRRAFVAVLGACVICFVLLTGLGFTRHYVP